MNPQELFSRAEHVTVSIPTSPSKEEFEAACIFFSAAKKLGKGASLQGAGLTVPIKEARVAREGKTFLVSLRGLANLISRIHYEKTGGDVKLYFTLSDGELSPSNIALETSQPSNLILIVGDRRAENNSETEDSSTIQGTRELLGDVLSLLSPLDIPGVRLSARILSRLQEKTPGLYLAHITQQDFIETTASEKSLKDAATQIREFGDRTTSYFIVFESRQGTRGILWSENPRVRENILSLGSGSSQNNWVLCSFARRDINTVLREIHTTLSP